MPLRPSAGVPPVVLLAGAACVMLAACATPDARAGRHVRDAWARPADSGTTGGAYLTVVNDGPTPVELVGGTTPAARVLEIHESLQHDGMTHMAARPSIIIGARDSLVMKPGGVHVMLLELTRALAVGDTVPVLLRFASGDSLAVRVPVRSP